MYFICNLSKRYRSTYKRKNINECKKRGPKAQIKVPQTCYECHKTFKSSALLTIHIRFVVSNSNYLLPMNP